MCICSTCLWGQLCHIWLPPSLPLCCDRCMQILAAVLSPVGWELMRREMSPKRGPLQPQYAGWLWCTKEAIHAWHTDLVWLLYYFEEYVIPWPLQHFMIKRYRLRRFSLCTQPFDFIYCIVTAALNSKAAKILSYRIKQNLTHMVFYCIFFITVNAWMRFILIQLSWKLTHSCWVSLHVTKQLMTTFVVQKTHPI